MNLSISNIAWGEEYDNVMYGYLQCSGFNGLEIAPTRIFPNSPYDNINTAKKFAEELKDNYKLSISSLQSIWFGRNEKVFGSDQERKMLVDYTKKAIDFAEAVGSRNLVFGCPKNRTRELESDNAIATSFFYELGEYAKIHNTVLALEPNPVLYGTNFINTTREAFELVKEVESEGFRINLDLGTIIYNNETLEEINDNFNFINHIHISEPNLDVMKKRDLHVQLARMISNNNYQGFVSIEMKKQSDLNIVKSVIQYVNEVFK